jgi:hypothetical protein
LVPVDLLPELPEISKQIALRGEKGSELEAIVILRPSEQGLKEVMDEWNDKIGQLPPEIYDMDVYEVEQYLRKKLAKLRGRR